MVTTEQKLARWVGFVEDLLRSTCPELPTAAIREQLWEAFGAEPSWNCLSSDGRSVVELMHPVDGWPSPGWEVEWREGLQQHNPLGLWYDATCNPAPQSRERVPSAIATRADHGSVISYLGPLGLEQHVAIPYHLSSAAIRMFVVARSGRDFSDDDMDLARRVQPLIWLVDRQVDVLAATVTTAAARLTGRELAVLGLLSQGRTAAAIGRRLGCSPRTVHKHLEHLYRKLEVRDRLMAVQRGRDLGLLAAPSATRR